ncbi:MAG TPA: ParA family protein [Thermoanaerobaculia bacterium]|nr:ParA family protein [Thermoanaerobaculia bacterium]
MTQIITFYSYKGGVGRTTALVNAAHVLARDGYRVLMVDLDLEAPGMTHFFAESFRSQRNSDGLRDSLDLLLEAKRTLAEADANELAPQSFCSLDDFIVRIRLPEGWSRSPRYLNGRLDLLPARINSLQPEVEDKLPDDYLERLDDLDLAGIFSPSGPRHRFGDHLRDYFLRARFTAPGDPLFVIRDEVRAAYDVVLIDSRTGLNEISGLCVGPLCDGLVVCCGLNRQSIAGSRYFLEKVGLLESIYGKPYIVVAGPVPAWRSRESAERISILRKSLGKKHVVEVPYHPEVALEENVFVTENPEEAISGAYRALAREIRREFPAIQADQKLRWLDAGWDDLGGPAAAPGLVEYLRARRVQPLERPGGALCRFPTASALVSMPRRMGSSSAPPPEIFALSAAVASYWTRSDRAFRRAWDLLSQGVGHGSPRLPPTVSKLVLLELRVLGAFRGSREDIETVKSLGNERYQGDLRLEYLLAMHLLGQGSEEAGQEIRAWFSSQERWGRYGTEFCSLLLVDSLNRDQVNALERAVSRLPKEVPKSGSSSRTPAPFGFWPESLLISALSVAREGKAIDETLELVKALRDRYGYAWRVLVDWHRLEKTKEHPLFQDLLGKEDAMVKEIESAIDQGIYPL